MQTEKKMNAIYRISGIICLLGIILYHGRNIYLEYVGGQISAVTIMSGIFEIIVYLLFSTVACHAFICVGTQDRNILTNIIFWIILGMSVALIAIRCLLLEIYFLDILHLIEIRTALRS